MTVGTLPLSCAFPFLVWLCLFYLVLSLVWHCTCICVLVVRSPRGCFFVSVYLIPLVSHLP